MQLQRIYELIEHHPAGPSSDEWIFEWTEEETIGISIVELKKSFQLKVDQLYSTGIRTGDKVVVLSDNSTIEELVIEMAVMKIGAAVAPLHRYYRDEEVEHIFDILQPKLILCQQEKHKSRVQPLISDAIKALTYDQLNEVESVNIPDLAPVDEHLCALIMFTSGTTSDPKGVMLSHKNILSNVEGLSECLPLKSGDIVVSYLPRSHVMERTATYTYLWKATKLYFIPSVLDLQTAVRQIRPKWMTSVPLVLERLYAHILETVEKGKWHERLLFSWSKRKGVLKAISLLLIGRSWKRNFGPGLRGIVVGGAALNPVIARFFSGTGCRIREGYGLTETSPAITFNLFPKQHNRFGTAGIPIKNVQVRIVDPNEDGEGHIEMTGPNVMLGYLNDDEATASKMTDDGWFKTGDIGKWVDDRFVKITDRSSNIYKNATGRFVAPAHVEQLLVAYPAVEQALLYGFNEPFNIALIVPNFGWLKQWAHENHIHWTDNAYMIHNPKIIDFYDELIAQVNREIKSHERVKQHVLSSAPWTMEEGLLSVAMKPRRKEIIRKYQKQIREIYDKSMR